LNSRIRQSLLFIALVSSVLSVSAVKLWSRLMPPPSEADVRELAEKAPIVFRGRVAQVSTAAYLPHSSGGDSFANIEVDRLYRGSVRKDPTIHFVYGSPAFMNGHNCIDFQPDTYWLTSIIFRRASPSFPMCYDFSCSAQEFPTDDRAHPRWPENPRPDFRRA
jgi:hypothetical protein